jgi:hypothetical protein
MALQLRGTGVRDEARIARDIIRRRGSQLILPKAADSSAAQLIHHTADDFGSIAVTTSIFEIDCVNLSIRSVEEFKHDL